MTTSVVDFLKRACERNGFARERFEEKNIPTDYSSLVIMPFFGDYRGLFVLSSLVLHRYRRENKGSKYFIVCSWPGFQGLFPYVDEYWALTDEPQMKRFYQDADNLRNRSDLATIYLRNLNEFFRDVVSWRDLDAYYDYGFKQGFFDEFDTVKRFLPFVPSAAIMGKEFNRQLTTRPGYKVFLHPTVYARKWANGRTHQATAKKEFWVELTEHLLHEGFVPVIWQNYLTYDLSGDFTDKCIFIGDRDISRVMAGMRATGCVLDIFNGISRLAIAARCPFLVVDERSRYAGVKEYEVDDLCAYNLPREYIFSFSTIITDGFAFSWKHDIFQSIVRKLNSFLPDLDRDTWPSTGELLEDVPYKEYVREIKKKHLGTRLLKITRD